MDFVLSGIHGIIAKTKALEKADFTTDMFEEIAVYVMAQIKDRTIKGEDVNGKTFKKYSASYVEQRKKKGYSISPVDLSFSGHMLSAMTSSASAKKAKIFFMDTKDTNDVSAPDKAFWNNETREFFGLSESDEKMIIEIVTDYYEKLTGRRTLK